MPREARLADYAPAHPPYPSGYGLPSLCNNRPSLIGLIMSMSEQVMTSAGEWEPGIQSTIVRVVRIDSLRPQG